MVLHFEVRGGDFAAAGEASSRLKAVLRQLGLEANLIRRVAIATYEAEMNVVIHAYHGRIEARIAPAAVEVAVTDEGPGIPDIELAMQEGYSTAPEAIREMGFGAGMGLPNMKRCADELRVESQVGVGTSVYMRFSLPGTAKEDRGEDR
ncbi:MAG: anti-sigma regulatory factor [Firmicutes bacterium]|nr:anti-sigma regulatory factor [Bacillota bacterium]